jgi:hypothetical protein
MIEILKNLNNDSLKKSFVWINEKNTTNFNPYHNNKHVLFVFSFGMFLFDMYKEEYNLTDNDRTLLGVACLFHDFNHSGGLLTDNGNIELALDGLNDFLKNNNELNLDKVKIEDILKSTEFPHKEINLNILQKIIRDADTIGGIMEDWLNIVISLSTEMEKTLSEFIPGQIKFLNIIKFNLPYCNILLMKRKDNIIKELNDLNEMFN